eukprot:CAMPEP_0178943692 /NCGR_PEP_ID=MMETSP0789-20121207/2728_1 /TAXON_ID=3005 /ORGANISM="Rhizosolenia setigera, Strain CCMP 1694" /LENGTH=307 /DNA_ID=CAMNT_0020623315 /DNA_START=140 /DNA_END=1063 /DNA_ORIENTATION=+
MDTAKPGHSVEFQGLKGAAHLNGTHGTLVKYLKKEQRWSVRCDSNNKIVNAKSQNLIRLHVQTAHNKNTKNMKKSQFNSRTTGPGTGSLGYAHLLSSMPGGPSMSDIGEMTRLYSHMRSQASPFSSSTQNNNVSPSAWANGLSEKDQYEWLSNCYTLRCDDDYSFGGCYLHGPYEPGASPDSIFGDFMKFCILAHRHRVIPDGWNWKAFLKECRKYIKNAFEKSDAVERWGSEDYFNGETPGGRSLRYTGVQIYRSGIEEGPESKEERQAGEDIMDDYEGIQKQIGGTEAWSKLLHELYRPLTSTNW